MKNSLKHSLTVSSVQATAISNVNLVLFILVVFFMIITIAAVFISRPDFSTWIIETGSMEVSVSWTVVLNKLFAQLIVDQVQLVLNIIYNIIICISISFRLRSNLVTIHYNG